MQVFLLILTWLAVACTRVQPGFGRGYINKKINSSAGLFYEQFPDVRFTSSYWRFLVFINVNITLPNESFVRQNIVFIKEKFKNSSMDHSLVINASLKRLEKTLEITLQEYNMLQDIMDDIKESVMINDIEDNIALTTNSSMSFDRDKRGIFSTLGWISRELYGILNQYDAERFHSEFEKIKNKQKTLSDFTKDQMHVILSHNQRVEKKMDEVIGELDGLKNDLDNVIKQIHKKNAITEAKLNLLMYEEFVQLIQASLDQFRQMYSNMLDMIVSARRGELHPHLLQKKELQRVIQHINEDGKYDFPVSYAHVTCEKLNKISEVAISVKNFESQNRLIISVKVPLLDKSEFKKVYKMHPVGIPQYSSKNCQSTYSSAYIQPQADYLLLSSDHHSYSFMSETQFQQCREFYHRKICVQESPVYSSSHNGGLCEYLMFINPTYENIVNCEIIKMREHQDNLIYLRSVNKWLYSFLGEKNIQVSCPERKLGRDFMPDKIGGLGILSVSQGCKVTVGGTLTLFSLPDMAHHSEQLWESAMHLNLTHLDLVQLESLDGSTTEGFKSQSRNKKIIFGNKIKKFSKSIDLDDDLYSKLIHDLKNHIQSAQNIDKTLEFYNDPLYLKLFLMLLLLASIIYMGYHKLKNITFIGENVDKPISQNESQEILDILTVEKDEYCTNNTNIQSFEKSLAKKKKRPRRC